METKEFSAGGYIYGMCWLGEEGPRESKNLIDRVSLDRLRGRINELMRSGHLGTHGMAFNDIYGAVMIISVTTAVVVDEKEYTRVDRHKEYFGNLTDTQREELDDKCWL